MILLKGLFQGRNLGGNVDHVAAGAVGLQDKVVILVVSGFHGFKGIAVVGVFESQRQSPLRFAPVHVILQSHFQGDLHSHAS